jgi:uncharacterized protein YjgD (DUF1641 family)
MKELRDDLTLIGKDVYQTAVVELDDISEHFDTEDLLSLFKKLLRNTRNLSRMLEQVEGAFDLFQDLKPLGKQVFNELLETLDEFDRKGYFEFMKAAVQIVDEVVTSFKVEDVQALRDNIVSIMLTVKNLTQPETLGVLNNAAGFFQKMDVAVDKDVSWGALFKELRDPEVKRGMMFLLAFAKNMATPIDNGKDNKQ